jgi:hypothetical protein
VVVVVVVSSADAVWTVAASIRTAISSAFLRMQNLLFGDMAALA